MKTLLLVAMLIAAGMFFYHPRTYVVQRIDTPQADGSVAHDYARVDVDAGTMCSLHESFYFNGSFVEPCEDVHVVPKVQTQSRR